MFQPRPFAAQAKKAGRSAPEEVPQSPFDAYMENGSGFEPMQRRGPEDTGENRTGMPDRLKTGLEGMSGMDLSGVRVHYNSAKPAEVGALAYTQGQDIHVGPGQERHLPHEGWHAVQQMEGRVKPTVQVGGNPVNDDAGLEREADVMGVMALQMRDGDRTLKKVAGLALRGGLDTPIQPNTTRGDCIQPMWWSYINGVWYPDDETTNPVPTDAGKNGDRMDDGLDVDEEEEEEEEQSEAQKFVKWMNDTFSDQYASWGDEINKQHAISIFNWHDDILHSGKHHGVRHVKLRTLKNDVEKTI